MNEKLARELVNAHAEALRQGYDVTDSMSKRYPELAPLFTVAQGVLELMEPVVVSAEFVSALQSELLQNPISVQKPEANTQAPWLIGGAVALTSAVTAGTIWAVRRFGQSDQPATA